MSAESKRIVADLKSRAKPNDKDVTVECNVIYHFMAESLKHNRNNDPGFLLARLMVNHENRFFIEGEKELEPYNKISEKPLS